MIKVGLTGGIGSGKTTVAKVFIHLGIPVFFADDASKFLLEEKNVIEKIVHLFGDSILDQNQIDKKKLATIVFSDKQKLAQLNALLHPLVNDNYHNWLEQNKNFPFTIKEAAILFESGSYKQCDKIITVSSHIETRIDRVIKRDGSNRDSVIARANNQWAEEQRLAKSDYIIYNNVNDLVVPQVVQIIEQLNAVK